MRGARRELGLRAFEEVQSGNALLTLAVHGTSER
jgi:hypothetical protein